MKVLQFLEFGDLGTLQLDEIQKAALGRDEVRIRIISASINPSDVRNNEGKMEGTTLPRIPGRVFAGTVVEGPAELLGLNDWDTGGNIGFTRDGRYAELIVIPAEAVIPKPSTLSIS